MRTTPEDVVEWQLISSLPCNLKHHEAVLLRLHFKNVCMFKTFLSVRFPFQSERVVLASVISGSSKDDLSSMLAFKPELSQLLLLGLVALLLLLVLLLLHLKHLLYRCRLEGRGNVIILVQVLCARSALLK